MKTTSMKPKYFKLHRVFSANKNLNVTVMRNTFSAKVGDFIYEIALDDGSKIWATTYTLTPENPIKWFIGDQAHCLGTEQDCEVIDIVAYNAMVGDWLVNIVLENGDKISTPQGNLCPRYRKKSRNE